jgi:hypothetical protein
MRHRLVRIDVIRRGPPLDVRHRANSRQSRDAWRGGETPGWSLMIAGEDEDNIS